MIKNMIKKVVPDKIWFLLIILKSKLKSLPYYLLRIVSIKNNKIVVCGFNGKGFGDNGKYIVLELLKHSSNYDIVWLADKVYFSTIPSQVRWVDIKSLKAVYELVTAKIWIDNARKELCVRKRKEQYYINTGHGGIPLKKVEKDAEGVLGQYFIRKAKHDSGMTDLLISHAKFRTKIMHERYWYDGEVYECGIPKIEILMLDNREIKEKVKTFYQLAPDCHIAMYAPTFRQDNSLEAYDLDIKRVKEELEKQFYGSWVIFVRMHPNLKAGFDLAAKYEYAALDVTDYPDMQELLISSDILITDYSGTMFETLYTDKIVFLYANDLQNYERGFYFDIHQLPFPLAENNQEMLKNIQLFHQEEYQEKVQKLKDELGLKEEFGASIKIADRIQEVIAKKEGK